MWLIAQQEGSDERSLFSKICFYETLFILWLKDVPPCLDNQHCTVKMSSIDNAGPLLTILRALGKLPALQNLCRELPARPGFDNTLVSLSLLLLHGSDVGIVQTAWECERCWKHWSYVVNMWQNLILFWVFSFIWAQTLVSWNRPQKWNLGEYLEIMCKCITRNYCDRPDRRTTIHNQTIDT